MSEKQEKEIRMSQSMMKEIFELVLLYHIKRPNLNRTTDLELNIKRNPDPDVCGLVFVEKYINGRFDLFTASESMSMGVWFEYQCIGATTKRDKVPQPVYLKDGKTLSVPYKRMEKQVENYKNFIKFYGIEVIEVQPKWIVDGLEGTLDMLCRATKDIKDKDNVIIIKAGEEFICDIKSSGLLNDKWSPYGWDIESLSSKEKIIRQPLHYKFLSILKYGYEMKFLYLLFSTTNENDYRSILFQSDSDHIEQHKEFIAWCSQWLNHFIKKGFDANPDVLRCGDCPIKIGCKHFAHVPKIQTFYYQPQTV
jgi:hypothetical protein